MSVYYAITDGHPIWLEWYEKVCCDQSEIECYLIQTLNYQQDTAAKLAQEIAAFTASLNPFIAWRFVEVQTEVLKVFLQCIDRAHLFTLLRFEGFDGCTILNQCVYDRRHEVMSLILDSLSEYECADLLGNPDDYRHTAVHCACKFGDEQSLSVMFEHLNPNMRYWILLQRDDAMKYFPLYDAASKGQNRILKMIHKSVSEEQWINLLQMKGRDHHLTVLQKAAYENNEDTMMTIRDTVTNDVWLELLTSPLPKSNTLMDQQTGWIELIDLYRPAARIEKALKSNGEDQQDQIQRIAKTEPLTVDQIKELSPYSPSYVVPHNQGKSKRYGLILFCSEHRQGAEEEANSLDQALKVMGCEVMKTEWSNADKLHNLIDSVLDRINADCSLLIVCLMAHGSRGTIYGGNGKAIPVNSILHQFSYKLGEHVPMVILIQACQVADRTGFSSAATSSNQDPAPTQLSDSQKDQHITLTRPHTILLHSTVREGVAYRGVFTGAMADQFRCSDGKTDIWQMFNRAVREMKRNNPAVAHQNPKFEAVTEKFLILPLANQNCLS